ncbi:methyl-accepting chemotaxis protein [Geomonas agri]|uniref:methyl-accepting chemotaxis protein n=1 Tax=Geomonas agri TaxID=2873702 RepID=UPI001CD4C377|nr:methyl-accepting chemotaxis protein [Geomonas agri]
MSIAKKMLLALGMTTVIVLICIMIPLLTSHRLDDVRNQLSDYSGLSEEATMAQELQLQIANLWQFLTDASLTRDRESIDKDAKTAYDKASQLVERMQKYTQHSAGYSADLKKIETALPAMWQTGCRMYDAYGRSPQEGNAVMEEYDKVCDTTIQTAMVMVKHSQADGRTQMQGILSKLSLLTTHVYTSGGVATAIGVLIIALVVWVRRSIMQSLKTMVKEVESLTNGNLSCKFDATGNDELATVSGMLNRLIETLHRTVSNIAATSSRISTASLQLHSTSDHIAAGARDVAEQAGSVATASVEMSATSGEIANNCRMASAGTQSASQAASVGADVVEKTVSVMGQIADTVQESTRTVESLGARGDQIGTIIGTIEDIADQTNLLALNAAIEAARAGEQGRGFAVVADEVRALAERTTRATREIGEMIQAIQRETKSAVDAMESGVSQVGNGKAEAARSGEAIRDILAHIAAAGRQVETIALAANEQSSVTNTISDNIQQITHLAHLTSDDANQSAAAAADLNRTAADLQELVRWFKL